ncbi:MAG: plasmid replication protein RepC [Pelagimonas sp.]|uniref:plasmid replication protein RepC n=1 Tax=Pelagimonas sp. TaxID=2073170 RepID=UPI003D6C176B
MTYHATTPFGQRSVTAGLLKSAKAARGSAPIPKVDKWELFRQLCTGRLAFGVTDRDLTVLNALLSFLPEKTLQDAAQTTVFPSNRALGERAHGMAESTLRRHLGALVKAGLITRQDSPNGKRYVRRDRSGDITQAFGFDLRPLLVHARAISEAARAAEDATARRKELREMMILKKRDAFKLSEFGCAEGIAANWDEIFDTLALLQRKSRRKLDIDGLQALHDDVDKLLNKVQNILLETEEMSGTHSRSERHLQNSKPDTLESEHCLEKSKASPERPIQQPSTSAQDTIRAKPEIKIPLALVLKACPDLEPYSRDPIRQWSGLYDAAQLVRGMMGISRSAWDEATAAMGPECASAVVAGMLQRVDEINNPGGYLRSLTHKAQLGKFSPGPMIMSLLNRGEAQKS